VTDAAGWGTLYRDSTHSLSVHFIKGAAIGVSIDRARRVGVFDVLGRSLPVATWTAPGGRSGTFTISAENDTQVAAVRALFSLGGPLQWTTCPVADMAGMWFIPTAFIEQRVVNMAYPHRQFDVTFTECDEPA